MTWTGIPVRWLARLARLLLGLTYACRMLLSQERPAALQRLKAPQANLQHNSGNYGSLWSMRYMTLVLRGLILRKPNAITLGEKNRGNCSNSASLLYSTGNWGSLWGLWHVLLSCKRLSSWEPSIALRQWTAPLQSAYNAPPETGVHNAALTIGVCPYVNATLIGLAACLTLNVHSGARMWWYLVTLP
jgi:hypothetical protein